MPTGNLAVLDTSVCIEDFRTGRFTLLLLRAPWVVRCSAVVLHELRRGARTPLERRFVGELARKVQILTRGTGSPAPSGAPDADPGAGRHFNRRFFHSLSVKNHLARRLEARIAAHLPDGTPVNLMTSKQ